MGHRKKVLLFLNAATGGAERVTVTIGKMLPKDQYEAVFVLLGQHGKEIESFIPNDYRIEHIYFDNIWAGVGFRIFKLLRRERPFSVFCSTMVLSVRVIIAAKLLGNIRVVIRNDNYFSVLRRDEFLLCKNVFRFADLIIGQQEEMRHDILSHVKIAPNKVIALQNPLDKENIEIKSNAPSPYKEKDAVKYLWVGRFDRTKGQDVLAKAFVLVSHKNSKAHLYFVGKHADDSFFHEVCQIVKDGGCSDRVHFIGYDSNPYRWMKHCDCFVLPSRIEGLPNSLIEAQYLGRPAVATTCIPIISRIVEEGKTGYTVLPENPGAMAEAMLKASTLGTIKSNYQSADNKCFIRLFETNC